MLYVALPSSRKPTTCMDIADTKYRILFSLTAIPGGADRALSPAARLRLLVTWTAVLGGLSASLMMVYRTMLRPNGVLGSWGGSWTTWILGRREL